MQLEQARKADRFLVPSINIVESVAVLVSIWDLIVNSYSLSWFNVVGLTSFVLGIVIYSKARKALGKFFSSNLRLLETQRIVTSGIYKYIRHPIYTGEILILLGFTLMLNSLPGFLIMLFLIPLILIRIPFEEGMLKEAHNEQYTDYMKRTKKLIPLLY